MHVRAVHLFHGDKAEVSKAEGLQQKQQLDVEADVLAASGGLGARHEAMRAVLGVRTLEQYVQRHIRLSAHTTHVYSNSSNSRPLQPDKSLPQWCCAYCAGAKQSDAAAEGL